MSVAVKHSSARDARMLRTYEDLARTVVAELYKPTENNCQTWIAIAGGPGSGKSTLAAALVERVNALCKTGAGNDVAVCLPMDGFHLSRQQLQEIADTLWRHLHSGKGIFDGSTVPANLHAFIGHAHPFSFLFFFFPFDTALVEPEAR